MRSRKRVLVVLTAVLSLLLPAGAVAAPATAPPGLALPAPTGAHPVGTAWLHLVDVGRPDPWRPDVSRELMVSLWYPAVPAARPLAPYTTAGVSARIIAAEGLPVPSDLLTTVRTNARWNAPVRPTPGGWPLVVLSPGFSLSRDGLAGWKRWLTGVGTGHLSFTDRPVLGAQLGMDPGAVPADRQLLITREYVAAFVDRHLNGATGALLDGPCPAYPEVQFRNEDA